MRVKRQIGEELSPQDFHDSKVTVSSSPEPAAEIKPDPVQVKIVWRNAIVFGILHLISVYGLLIVPTCKPLTWLFSYALYVMGCMGITAGAHRLWSHKSYKARLPLRVILMVWTCIAGQNSVIEWSRDHRVHHKYSETNADPHNAKRGFFFAHIGWLMCKKHPDVINKGRQLDFSDLCTSRLLRFQARFYNPLFWIFSYLLPTLLPLLWGESIISAFCVCGILRYVVSLHMTWLINSAAHMWGMRPYDKHINPAENFFTTLWVGGEGFHNYHHTFPQDYATSEHGMWFNVTTIFINVMAKFGWAYDLKTISMEAIIARRHRTGDLNADNSAIEELEKEY